jgi:hypothetical protein
VRRYLPLSGHALERLRVNVQELRRFVAGQRWLECYRLMTHKIS